MNQAIVLELCAGFANRLRALVSGICYAEEEQKQLKIHWTLHPTCYCPIQELIDLKSLPSFVSISQSFLIPEPKLVLKQEDLESKPTYIKSYAHFYTKNRERFLFHLRNIRFKTTPNTNKSIVGVHIRRTDHTKCIDSSPLNYFIETMNSFPSDTLFYLATDCDITKHKMIQLYKERLFTSTIVLHRACYNGIKGAVEDFSNLANCKTLIGTKYSSFSEMIALYGNIPLVINQDVQSQTVA